jgi:hypothetical protein
LFNGEFIDSCVRLKVFTAVAMKITIFWDVTPCGSYKNDVLGECVASSSVWKESER